MNDDLLWSFPKGSACFVEEDGLMADGIRRDKTDRGASGTHINMIHEHEQQGYMMERQLDRAGPCAASVTSQRAASSAHQLWWLADEPCEL